MASRAGVTQLAECLLPKQNVAGSNPVSRSTFPSVLSATLCLRLRRPGSRAGSLRARATTLRLRAIGPGREAAVARPRPSDATVTSGGVLSRDYARASIVTVTSWPISTFAKARAIKRKTPWFGRTEGMSVRPPCRNHPQSDVHMSRQVRLQVSCLASGAGRPLRVEHAPRLRSPSDSPRTPPPVAQD